MSDPNRTEAEVLESVFQRGASWHDGVEAVAAKVRELDAPEHTVDLIKAVKANYEIGLEIGKRSTRLTPKPPQPPKPKTGDHFSPEAHAIYDALKAAGHLTGLATCEIAAQAAHEFLSKPKMTAGELLHRATYPGGSWAAVRHFDRNDYEDRAQAFLRLAREHGLLEAGE